MPGTPSWAAPVLAARRRRASSQQCTPSRHQKQSEATELDPRTRSTSAWLQRCWCGRAASAPPPHLHFHHRRAPPLPPLPLPPAGPPTRTAQQRTRKSTAAPHQRPVLLLKTAPTCRSLEQPVSGAAGVAGRWARNFALRYCGSGPMAGWASPLTHQSAPADNLRTRPINAAPNTPVPAPNISCVY